MNLECSVEKPFLFVSKCQGKKGCLCSKTVGVFAFGSEYLVYGLNGVVYLDAWRSSY